MEDHLRSIWLKVASKKIDFNNIMIRSYYKNELIYVPLVDSVHFRIAQCFLKQKPISDELILEYAESRGFNDTRDITYVENLMKQTFMDHVKKECFVSFNLKALRPNFIVLDGAHRAAATCAMGVPNLSCFICIRRPAHIFKQLLKLVVND